MLGKQSYRPETAALESQWQALVDALGEKVPLWRMGCNLDPQAAVVACEAMRF